MAAAEVQKLADGVSGLPQQAKAVADAVQQVLYDSYIRGLAAICSFGM